MLSRNALHNGPVTIEPGQSTNLRLPLHVSHSRILIGVGQFQSGEDAAVAVYGEQSGLEYLPRQRVGCQPVIVPVAPPADSNILVVFSPDAFAKDSRTVTVVVAAS